MTSNEAMMVFIPKTALDLQTNHIKPNMQKVLDPLKMRSDIAMIREEVKDVLALAKFTMAEQYDKNHKIMDLRTGDWLFINFASKNKVSYMAAGNFLTGTGAPESGPIQGFGNGWTKHLSGGYSRGLEDLASNKHSQPENCT
jgi:hypothetical protein